MATEESTPVKKPVKFRLLFVDDEEPILRSLQRLMRRHPYECWFASSAREGLSILEKHPIDLIISDMRMPEMDGAQFLAEVHKRWPFSVRFLLTGYADMDSAVDALNFGGINRYISKPWNDDALIQAIEEGLRIRRLEREKKRLLDQTRQQNKALAQLNEQLESRVVERTQALEDTNAKLGKAFRQLERGYESFVRVFSSVIENRPQLVKGHSRYVADLARHIAQKMDLERAQIKYVYYAALLHELGKLSLSDDVLSRSETRLTHRDQEEYQQYPALGELALMPIKALRPSAEMIRAHNEHLDGTGYPDGLRGQHIPLGARIIKPARDFIGLQTELMSETPYSAEAAFKYIQARAGTLYDESVVAAMEDIVRHFSFIRTRSYERKIPSVELKPGMMLARDLVNTKGILMMVKGARISERTIQRVCEVERLERRSLNIYIMAGDESGEQA